MVSDNIKSAISYIKRVTEIEPELAIVLGSNLGDVAKHFDIRDTVPYIMLDDFPLSKTKGHKGRFLFGYLQGIPTVFMQGRVHYYEGYTMEEVVTPIQILKSLGVKTVILTNSAAAVSKELAVRDLAIIEDHIMLVPNPMRNRGIDYYGDKMSDLSTIYDQDLNQIIKNVSNKIYDVRVKTGVYCQVAGPSLNTVAEIEMYRNLGISMIGMSTACEALYARHLGMKVAAISNIYSYAAGTSGERFTYNEMQENAKANRAALIKLLERAVRVALEEGKLF